MVESNDLDDVDPSPTNGGDQADPPMKLHMGILKLSVTDDELDRIGE